MSRLTAADFYDPECPQIHIPLDPLLTPQQNAAKYYKEYNKAKTAESILTLQLEKGRRDLDYLNSVLEAIALAEGERDLPGDPPGAHRHRISPPPLQSQRPGASGWPRSPWSSAPPPACVSPWAKTTPRTTCSLPSRLSRATCGSTPRRSTAPTSSCGPRGDSRPDQHPGGCPAGRLVLPGPGERQSGGRLYPGKICEKPGGARPGMVVYTTYETAYVAPDGELARRLRVK